MSEYKRKLIEVALPLEAINECAMHEKSVPRKGHPATLHLWWARRPLVACRAVLFSSLVDDPSEHPELFPTEAEQELERQRLFALMEQLCRWENSTNVGVLASARAEILKSTNGKPPVVIDPFAGGGSIPLEAQRLGLQAYARDLNPVAVLISKAIIEIAPRFAGQPPVQPKAQQQLLKQSWDAAAGLASDIRFYGDLIRTKAAERLGQLYPEATYKTENGTKNSTTVVAWIWARCVKCPNPACGLEMPLVRSFQLSSKKDKRAWIEPQVVAKEKRVRFTIRKGDDGKPPTGTVNRRGAVCLGCSTPVSFDHVRDEAVAGRMTARLMAIVGEGARSRLYIEPAQEHEDIARKAEVADPPETSLPEKALGFRVQRYGMTKHKDLFTNRQLLALTTLAELINDMRQQIEKDAVSAGLADDGVGLEQGGTGARAYAEAVCTYLSFAVSKLADWCSTICSWIHSIEGVRDTFARHAIPMVWDFVEVNPLSNSVGNFSNHIEWVSSAVQGMPKDVIAGQAHQLDATSKVNGPDSIMISTDPPYYDNVPYADLSDFFYIWLRRCVGSFFPSLFKTMLVPKADELVADPFRHGGKDKAQKFFEDGLKKAFAAMREKQDSEFPLTVYYAFKQSETDDDDDNESDSAVASTGWETMLEGLIKAEFVITGTWPMRTERSGRSRDTGSNALASSIVLVCRPRPVKASVATSREFISVLKRELPEGLRQLRHGNIAPVDFAQAAIGPGIAVFSRYSRVINESDGADMSVRTALQLINKTLDEVLSEQEGEFDADTRWALAWFEQFGMSEGPYGIAETLSKAKNTSVSGLEEAGILTAKAGKVRLLNADETMQDWDPSTDQRLTIWEVCHYLSRELDRQGEESAAQLLSKVTRWADSARDLSYRLYSICERKKWPQEALSYNALVVSWPRLKELANKIESSTPKQLTMTEI